MADTNDAKSGFKLNGKTILISLSLTVLAGILTAGIMIKSGMVAVETEQTAVSSTGSDYITTTKPQVTTIHTETTTNIDKDNSDQDKSKDENDEEKTETYIKLTGATCKVTEQNGQYKFSLDFDKSKIPNLKDVDAVVYKKFEETEDRDYKDEYRRVYSTEIAAYDADGKITATYRPIFEDIPNGTEFPVIMYQRRDDQGNPSDYFVCYAYNGGFGEEGGDHVYWFVEEENGKPVLKEMCDDEWDGSADSVDEHIVQPTEYENYMIISSSRKLWTDANGLNCEKKGGIMYGHEFSTKKGFDIVYLDDIEDEEDYYVVFYFTDRDGKKYSSDMFCFAN